MLEEISRLTGFESVYLTRINWRDHEQEILGSVNQAPSRLFIPEEVKIDYSDSVCRYVIEGGPDHTDDAPVVFAGVAAARFLGFQSFASAPIEDADGEVLGTLCGASTSRVALTPAQVDELRRRARELAALLRARELEGSPEIVFG